MNYRRADIKGGAYFFTVVTHKRQKILCDPKNIHLLRSVFADVMLRYPFTIDAIVVLPDHLHCLWTLPAGDNDFSLRWRLIKSGFTRKCDDIYKQPLTVARKNKKEQAIWQRRFWEHLILNERDYINHVEYIHYNPVKHGLVNLPLDWSYSSFQKFVRNGVYDSDWGANELIEFDLNIGNE